MEQYICHSRGCILEKKRNEICCSILHNCAKLDVFNYLENYPSHSSYIPTYVEVRFKNTRKDFFINEKKIPLTKGDIVVVEAQVGHDIGIVNATGEIVMEQLRVKELSTDYIQKKIYRKAKASDLEKWYQAISLEHSTMIRSRQISKSLGLEMKISDVEYQGDKSKAIFYYIADERVDFRELIKLLAAEFHVKIEMKQIGVRQEAGRIGGIGSCGRELCCTTWLSDFVSVPTTAAKLQELTPNPQKLTGQCSKLKCCLNYELDVYIDARKYFPNSYEILQISDGELYCQKIDIFRAIFWYSRTKDSMIDLQALSIEQVKNIISQNEKGIKPDLNNFIVNRIIPSEFQIDFSSELNNERTDRFDTKKYNKKRNQKFGNIN